jgi:hypothetical protein
MRLFFTKGIYLIGDSAFTNSNILVNFYKQASGQAVSPSGQRWFIDVLNVTYVSAWHQTCPSRSMTHPCSITIVCITAAQSIYTITPAEINTV